MRFRAQIACILLSMLFLPLLLMHWAMKREMRILKHETQHQILCGLPKHELQTLRFSEQDQKALKWEHNREFEWKGQMFDVLELHREDGELVVLCWPDNKESELKRELRQLWAKALGSDPIRQDQKDRLQHLMNHLFLEQWVLTVHCPELKGHELRTLLAPKILMAHTLPLFSPPEA